MIYDIVFSAQAIETFDAIREQIDLKWGKKILIDFEKRTSKVLDVIQYAPFIFQVINNNPSVRKGFIHRNCSLFYEVRETRIEVLFFWDNRQDPLL